jgi:hypothetical protein
MGKSMFRAGAGALAMMATAAGAASIGTSEYTEFVAVWLTGSTMEHSVPALLNLPPGWQAGDAAVVIAKGRDLPEGLRYALTAAVIDAGAAVLEVHVEPGREKELPRTLADGLAALRGSFGAGLVVAVGGGVTAPAVLRAVDVERPDVGGYNAAAATENGRLRVMPGFAPGVSEGWPMRASMLCGMLAGALGAPPREFVEGCARELAGW